jgi:hypothetical protein
MCVYCDNVTERANAVEGLLSARPDWNEEPRRTITTDFLADLRHFAEAQGWNFDEMLATSEMHWEEERHGGGAHHEA